MLLTMELLSLAIAADEVKTPARIQDLAATLRAHVLPRFEQLADDVPATIRRRPLPNGHYAVSWLPHAERAVFLGYDKADFVARVQGIPTAVYMAHDGRLMRLTVTVERDEQGMAVWEQGFLSLVSDGVLGGIDRDEALERVKPATALELSPAKRAATPVARA